jgi:hypothetical protein
MPDPKASATAVKVHLVAIGRQLDTVCQSAFNVLKEGGSTPAVSPCRHPTDNQLALRFNCGEGPDVARKSRCIDFGRHLFLLAVAKAPDFVDLHALGGDVPKRVTSWYSEHAWPTSDSSRRMVPLATPVMRTVERIEHPSTRTVMTATLFSMLILYMNPV